jgi:nucleoside phosphorylase
MKDQIHPRFLIISALQIEHYAVLKRLHIHKRLEPTGAVYVSLEDAKNSPIGIALALSEPGRLNAAVLTTKAFQLWRPEVILLVGLSGGFNNAGVFHGDILVATEIIDYEQQKLTMDGSEVRLRSFFVSKNLLNAAISTASKKWWKDLGNTPNVHFGPVFSGEKIVASKTFSEQLQELRNDALGIEMEGSGVATAVNHDPTEFLMIRGVADYANETKSDVFQDIACNAAAQFATAVLQERFDVSNIRNI